MIDILICGWSLSCHARNLFHQLNKPEYPEEYTELCFFIKEQKIKMPEHCKWENESKQPRKRNEF